MIAEVARGSQADVDRAAAGCAAQVDRPARDRAGQVHLPHRPPHPGMRRELAVAESMDGGKPIRESRDVDIPLAAQHFFYHAGWADKLEYAFAGRSPQTRRRVRADHPVEFPAADGLVEARAGSGLRQHVRPQTRRNNTADRAHAGRDLRRSRVRRRAW